RRKHARRAETSKWIDALTALVLARKACAGGGGVLAHVVTERDIRVDMAVTIDVAVIDRALLVVDHARGIRAVAKPVQGRIAALDSAIAHTRIGDIEDRICRRIFGKT